MYAEVISILNNSFIIFLYSLLGGILPALFWLWFWLHEENKHHEPRKIVLMTFLLGMLGVFVCFIIQKSFSLYFGFIFGNKVLYENISQNYLTINLIFVIIEEFTKFAAAYVIFFKTKIFNQPIDAFIYLMTAALGFAAMENVLYLIHPFIQGQTMNLILNSYLRFIGANVLHVASSGLLALFIGYSFCKKPMVRELYIWFGLLSAILLHWMFNLVLIRSAESIVFVFLFIWIVSVFLIISLEKMKRITC